jgi:hypothetical protein
LAAVSPNVLVVHPSIPANNVAELIAFLKGTQENTALPMPELAPRRSWPAKCSKIRKASTSLQCRLAVQRLPSNRRSPAIHQLPLL